MSVRIPTAQNLILIGLLAAVIGGVAYSFWTGGFWSSFVKPSRNAATHTLALGVSRIDWYADDQRMPSASTDERVMGIAVANSSTRDALVTSVEFSVRRDESRTKGVKSVKIFADDGTFIGSAASDGSATSVDVKDIAVVIPKQGNSRFWILANTGDSAATGTFQLSIDRVEARDPVNFTFAVFRPDGGVLSAKSPISSARFTF